MDVARQPTGYRRGAHAADYDVVDADLARDREAVIGVWRGVLGWEDELERMYDAFYRNCPFGPSRMKLLRYRPSGTIVGTIGVAPRPMLWRGEPCIAGTFGHFAVAKEHRSLRPAIKLSQAMATTAADMFPISYAMTTPTGVAAARRGGYVATAKLQRWVKWLRFGPIAGARVGRLAGVAGDMLDDVLTAGRTLRAPWPRPRGHAQWVTDIDPRMQALWESSAHGDHLMTVRSTRLMRWRFLDLPATDRRFLLVTAGNGAPLSAWFACETFRRTPTFMIVTDAWFARGVEGADRNAIRQLSEHARAAGFAAIEVFVTAASAVTAAWQAEGFAPRGEQPFYLQGIDVWRADGSAALHITGIDQDG